MLVGPLPPQRWHAPARGGVDSRTAQTGVLVAASIIPQTFASSLTPRSWTDQGIVTGLGTSLDYLFTVMTVDALDTVAATAAVKLPVARAVPAEQQRRIAQLIVDAAVVPAGIVVQRSLIRRPEEPLARGLFRQAAWRITRTGTAALVLTGTQAGAELLGRRIPNGDRIARVPMAIPAGLAVAAVVDRVGKPPAEATGSPVSPALLPSLAASAAVLAGLNVFAAVDHAVARGAGRVLAGLLPGSERWWRLAGHAGFLGLLAVAGTGLFDHVVRGLEEGATAFEPFLDQSVDPTWIGPTVSGGPESVVPWATLGREGRRHAFAHVRPRPVAYRPPGVPDLSIPTVMGRPARASPVQVYVGLDSAPDARARVALAMRELDRTDAWNRSVLMLISPTGTGYVNYCAVAAAEYLTLGDIATVTLQYSKRPSPLSLTRIGAAREQNRLLLLHVLQRLRDRPSDRRPRVVLFGESLGAHTSQDVLMHWGTLGPQALGIDRALWIGTPCGSKWMRQVTGRPRPDVDPDLIAVFNDFAQYAALPPARRARLRYVLVSHDNDGVTKFGPDLITTRPSWLDDGRPPVEEVAGASPRGVPPGMRWRPLTTFLQTFIDMKNAQIPGTYRAYAHDYRPDLARFLSAVFDLPATEEQMTRIERALEERETARAQLFAPVPLTEAAAPR